MVGFRRSARKNANFGPSRTVRFAMTSQVARKGVDQWQLLYEVIFCI